MSDPLYVAWPAANKPWPADDSWCIQFVAPVTDVRGVTSMQPVALYAVSLPDAERFLCQWRSVPGERVGFCPNDGCDGAADCAYAWQRIHEGWFYREITRARIMPMREAIASYEERH